MTRRSFLSWAAAVPLAAQGRSGLGFSPDCFVIVRQPRDPVAYLEYAHARGAGGVQASFTNPEQMQPEYLRKARERKEQLGMFLEIATRLPESDPAPFEATVKAAKECGASCIRTVCLGGRRYETFSTLEEWKKFVENSKARLAKAVPIAEKHKFPIGLENHKDFTCEEFVPLLKSYSSEYLGACFDFGNNLSLLDDAMELAEKLAPFMIATHIKDMAVEEFEDGFLMSEVALGTGALPLKKMVDVIRAARPKVNWSLDMLTRDPLVIPCLTEKYWATFESRNGVYLARTMRMVRANKRAQPLPRVTRMDRAAALEFEQQNAIKSVEYARDHLNIRL
jgi:sugar phosphate isomerase/epimerase